MTGRVPAAAAAVLLVAALTVVAWAQLKPRMVPGLKTLESVPETVALPGRITGIAGFAPPKFDGYVATLRSPDRGCNLVTQSVFVANVLSAAYTGDKEVLVTGTKLAGPPAGLPKTLPGDWYVVVDVGTTIGR